MTAPKTPRSDITENLRSLIADRGNKRPTINDVARWAGVSKKTVSRVINDSPFVQQETREKIQAIIDETGYAPDPQARGLAFRRSFLIGLIYDSPHPYYVVNMQRGLLDGIRGTGYELLVHPCDRNSPTFLAEMRAFVQRQKLYGVVLTPRVSEQPGVAEMLEESGCEYVLMGSVSLDEPKHMIVSHDREGGAIAGRYLGGLGHKRVAFISGPVTFRSSQERRAGFEAGLSAFGVVLDPALVFIGAYTIESGLACGEALLALGPPPTAVFAGNDDMAAGIIQVARTRGVRIPEDLSVMGFDDFEIAAHTFPPLTTIHAPTREIGRLAALKLLGQTPEDELAPTAAHMPSLVVRASTMALAPEDA